MAIYDFDGTTYREIGKSYDFDGTTYHQHGKIYDFDGTTYSLIYQDSLTMIENSAFKGGIQFVAAQKVNNGSVFYYASSISGTTLNSGHTSGHNFVLAYFNLPVSGFDTLTCNFTASASASTSGIAGAAYWFVTDTVKTLSGDYSGHYAQLVKTAGTYASYGPTWGGSANTTVTMDISKIKKDVYFEAIAYAYQNVSTLKINSLVLS